MTFRGKRINPWPWLIKATNNRCKRDSARRGHDFIMCENMTLLMCRHDFIPNEVQTWPKPHNLCFSWWDIYYFLYFTNDVIKIYKVFCSSAVINVPTWSDFRKLLKCAVLCTCCVIMDGFGINDFQPASTSRSQLFQFYNFTHSLHLASNKNLK